ncbi:type II toxin-antitoxin system Phd/YefM family antitoxin [Burkholderia glumae]|uniref:type II toxin-antitoxin system Phd/YefM family antitoxin n=1 Tax=Burkholderia glumae TaxID=337 RepID=UPI0001A4AF9C|nr:type II toxin-antitoxin system Phd/YefM family antitoxin [Burkholderia glumae]ACR32590.1 antitoxin of toxin-antitoxin stability system [Burkholderia glumae BGR1]UVS88516.1 type II toxin-antitoxin system Phd/YefM family antitoxin [Burkholderia glumae]UVS88701.1 type II toxin-antitoxin system Phd/YefM family antitoxin [Burkholderia glumae]UVT05736.1 type II toxin-antitoxin system Phd/YefM family antitoxin [Burkholderia glumae]
MTTKTFTSREFNQFVSDAKRAANDGPVLITDRGVPAYALLNIHDYYKMQGKQLSLADALAQVGPEADFDFEVPRVDVDFKPADLS